MPTTTTGNLTDQSAANNLGAAQNLGSLSELISGLNQNAYLSAPGRQQQLGTIQNQLAGNLDPSTIYENQLKNAEQYGAGGFSGDSQAWQTAIQRGLGLTREDTIKSGQNAMNQFYSGMPQTDITSQMGTPGLLEQQQATAAAQALEQQRIANQAAQFTAAQAQQASQFGTTSGQNAAHLYASLYGSLPGYNEYGQYTGQSGTYPYSTYSGGTGSGAAGGAVASGAPSTQQYLGAGTKASPYTPNPQYSAPPNDPGSWNWLQEQNRQANWMWG